MKRFFLTAFVAGLSLPLLFVLQGCFKDSCSNTYTIYTPVYKTLSQVRAEMKSEAPQPLVTTGKIYVYGNYIFLNEVRKGIHVIDNTDPAHPKNKSFIRIPGNVDLAVKGNLLYADCYSDVIVFDISNPANVSVKKFMNNVIKEFGYFWGTSTNPDSVSILVDYAKKDTVVNCETVNAWDNCGGCRFFDARGNVFFAQAAQAQPSGSGGSMARLSIVNNYMYGVSTNNLYAFDISNGADPHLTNTKNVGWGIETIYPFQNKLFLGSTNGMFIYDISNPSDPVSEGKFDHASSCDPVISDGQHAYVTLRSGSECQGYTNQLDVLDISNLSNPSLIKTYPMTNPRGLAKDGKLLFLCDGKSGLRIYNAVNPGNILPIKTFGGMETFDVIALNGIVIVVAENGLYQYDYSNPSNIKLISKIEISK